MFMLLLLVYIILLIVCIKITLEQLEVIPNKLSEAGKIMNEGCGRVAKDFGEKWCRKLKIEKIPAAFQV